MGILRVLESTTLSLSYRAALFVSKRNVMRNFKRVMANLKLGPDVAKKDREIDI